MLAWLAGLLVLALTLWVAYTYFFEGRLAQPSYTVVEDLADIEIRHYQPFNIASTQSSEDGESGLRSGFRVLANYIFGGNEPGESMAMTAPVLQESADGEALPAGPASEKAPGRMRMAFVMAADRGLSDLPTPTDSSVSLHRVDWGYVAALRYRGWTDQEEFREVEARLRATLKRHGIKTRGAALYAQYNSPYAFPLLRRNEVLIPVDRGEN